MKQANGFLEMEFKSIYNEIQHSQYTERTSGRVHRGLRKCSGRVIVYCLTRESGVLLPILITLDDTHMVLN